MRKPKFEIHRSNSRGDYFWSLVAANGRRRCSSDWYPTYNKAVRAIKGVVTSVDGDPENIVIVDRCGTGA